MIENFPGLAGLAGDLSAEAAALSRRWEVARRLTARWVSRQPDLLELLREQLAALPPVVAAEVAAGSRETTTHFAWRLVDEPGQAWSLWLHEYKPQRDWWAGYANSVHNHRYHFCTTLLSGSYLHERFTAELDDTGTAIRSVARTCASQFVAGSGGHLLSHEFHRIPRAADGTVTFLVKSRMVAPWSVSYDPATGLSQQHIPMRARLAQLAGRF